RDQANGQWQQGGRKMRCREESEASSMIHRGALSGRVTGSVPSVTSQERRLSFNSPELIQGGTQATPRVKTARISWKSLALARSHPFVEDHPLVFRNGDHHPVVSPRYLIGQMVPRDLLFNDLLAVDCAQRRFDHTHQVVRHQ